MAQRTLPQLASEPNMAAFVSDEQTTLLATVLAVSLSFAPLTLHSSSFVAPSPSAAILRQSHTVIVLRAFMNSLKSSPSLLISLFPASPFASTVTMSFVEVSPSMLIILKVSAMSEDRAFWSISLLIAQSVVMKTSIVAMLG